MSIRMLVTECFDGNHAACKGYNGPADTPNFRCDCNCHQTVSDKDKALAQGIVREWAEHDMNEHYNSDYLRDEFGSEHLEQRIQIALATVRREAREEAVKTE